MKMKRVGLTKLATLEFQEVDLPTPGEQDVIVKVERVGICGSDIHIYHGDYPGIKTPLVLGHEFAGTIYSKGSSVKNYEVGDHVAAEPGIGCGKCYYCLSGNYNLCNSQDFIGARPNVPGAYAEYVSVPEKMLIPMPDGMSFERGAMIEPVAVAMHALGRGKIESGDTVLVIGSGTIGLLIAQAVRMNGATTVIVADISQERLEIARKLGADAVVNCTETDLVVWCKENYGEKINKVYDVASLGPTFDQALRIVRGGGRIVNVGEATKPIEFQRDMLGSEIELTGSRQYMRPDFEKAVEAIMQGKIIVEPIVSAVYPLANFTQAFEAVLHDPKKVRVMLAPHVH